MKSATERKPLRLCAAPDIDLKKTFECGQCFRWNADEGGMYVGVASGRAAGIWADGPDVLIDAYESDMAFWARYFDLSTDYCEVRKSIEAGDYLRACAAYGAGIRILHQDKWEALCSFIISQCNNIPRIKGIIEKLCALYGSPLEYRGRTLYAFPTPERLAALPEGALEPLRSGYRAKYISEAAKAAASGSLDLDGLSDISNEAALAEFKKLPGVGSKVASCAILFGLHRLDAFPVDVWVKKAMSAHLAPDFDPAVLGEYAGFAQQCMFYYARSTGNYGAEYGAEAKAVDFPAACG